MEALNPEPLTEFAFPYFKDPNNKFKQVLSLAKTTDVVTYVFISEDSQEFFGLNIDKSEENKLTLAQISNLISEQLSDKKIQVTRSYFSSAVDDSKTISYFQDSQPLYFKVVSVLKIQVELDETISKEKTVFNFKISEEDRFEDFIKIVTDKINRPFRGLSFERQELPKSKLQAPVDTVRPDDPTQKEITVKLILPLSNQNKDFKVYESDKVSYLKKLAEKEWGMPAKDQLMYFSGKLLKDNETLKSYGVEEGRLIHLLSLGAKAVTTGPIKASRDHLIKMTFVDGDKLVLVDRLARKTESKAINIQVKTLTGKTIDLVVNADDTAEIVKLRIEEKEHIPPDQQRLVYAGSQLQDEDMLCEFGIEEGCILHLVLRLRGGGGAPFVDLSNKEGMINIDWSEDAPDWRVAAPGLCLEGVCNNKDCVASGQMVVMPQNFGTFDLIMDIKNAKCPMCKQSIDPLACGFSNCLYTFCGVKLEGDGKHERVSNQGWLEAGDFYQYYDPRESGIVQWLSLKIYTQRMPYNYEELDEVEDDAQNAICVLCKEKISSSDKRLECGHKSHEACLEKLQKGLTNTCLLCHLH